MTLNLAKDRNSSHGEPRVLAVVTKNSVANLTKIAALSITVFLPPPILVRVLDKPSYATWVLILQISTYVALFDGSIQLAISRFVARSRGLNDDRYMGLMLSSAGIIMLGAAFVTAALAVLGSWQLNHLFSSIPSSIELDAQHAFLIFGLSLAAALPFSTLAGAFLGLQMNEVNALAGSVGRVFGVIGATWAAYRHHSLQVMALWMASGYLIQATLYLVTWQRLKLHGLFRLAHVTSAAVREFTGFCYAILVSQLGGVLITGLDMPIVVAFDFHSAAYYAVAATVSTMLTVPQSAVVNTLIPVAAGLSATSNPDRLGAFVIKSTRYSTAILCLIILPLLWGMGPFLRLWVGLDYARHAVPMAVLLVLAHFIRLTLLPYAGAGFAAGQQHRMLVSPLGEGIVNLLCSLVGARYLGAVGVALGTVVGACVGVLLHFTNSMPRTDEIHFHRGKLILTGILRPMICCLPAFLIVLLAASRASNQFMLAAFVCGGEMLALLMLWKFNFRVEERNEIIEHFAKRRRLTS